MANFKPMLACDWYEGNLKTPCLIQPKIDGVHALVRESTLYNRTMKRVPNKKLSAEFSKSEFNGICGEMTKGTDPTAEDLCRKTTSVMSTIDGSSDVILNIFDYIPDKESEKLPYMERIDKIPKSILLDKRFRLVPTYVVNSIEELLEWEKLFLDQGYEGVIIRDPTEPYKYGRCGKTNMACWRVKRMIEEEILVEEVVEGSKNNNASVTNALGRTERSTHAENMVPNGMVGSLKGKLLKDVVDPITGNVLLKKGTSVTVSAGGMTEKEKKFYFDNPSKLIGEYVKFKMFPRGVKDKPRFPVFVAIRPKTDMILS